jgi:superfamily II DNA or RNA helicase
MSRIVDNQALTLESALRDAVSNSKAFDACVGYFNLRGWSAISKELDPIRGVEPRNSPVRLLIGMAVPEADAVREDFEAVFHPDKQVVDLKLANSRAERAVQGFVDQLVWGVPNSSDKLSIRHLLSDLETGLITVKLAARRRLHAKLYLCHMSGGAGGFTAFVGSSNFTKSGLSTSGELNLEETDKQKGEELATWFSEQWDDIYSIDITEQLIETLKNSWAAEPQPSPRLVHLRLAYELSRDARSGVGVEIPTKILKRLVEWQENAVRVGAKILANRGLVVVGDVVGLGKTIVGTAIAATMQERTLVICPKNLVNMWEQYFEEYEVHGRVVSLSMVNKVLGDLRHYGVVIIDESHGLRHTTRLAWGHVRSYIQENNSKVILLTATLFNANVKDISGQLGLKLDKRADLGVRPETYIASLQPHEQIAFEKKVEGYTSSLEAFDQSEEAEDWKRLLSLFLVRRTRKYLLEHYSKLDKQTGERYFEYRDGTRFHFPDRIPLPLEYIGGKDDPCDQLASIENFEAIEGMTYARYQLGKYFAPDFAPQDDFETLLREDLTRATASRGFIETTVLKRLASSPKAFFITVEKMLLRAHVLRYALQNDLDLPIGTISDRSFGSEVNDFEPEIEDEDFEEFEDVDVEPDAIDGSWAKGLKEEDWRKRAENAYNSLLASKPKGLRLARPSMFDKDLLIKAVEKDNETLQSIIDAHGAWNPENDTKLEALVNQIKGLGKDEKLLVFSEYADSIKYIEKHIVPRLPQISIGSVTGGTDDPTKLARQFSPLSNEDLGGLPSGTSELQVLLSTDVLSEGQNLQDAAMVLNWDLPWTIIKIIQRAGRVDRVGQKSKQIKVLSFKPHNGLEGQLKLLSRLRKRLEVNQEILGGGETIFDSHLTDEFGDLYSGKAGLLDDEGEVDYASFAHAIWTSATNSEQQKARALGKGSHTTSGTQADHIGEILAYTQATKGEDQVFDIIAVTGQDGKNRTISQMEALNLTASVESKAVEELENHHEQVATLIKETMYPQAAQKPVLVNLGTRKKLFDFMARAISELPSADPLYAKVNELHTQIFDNALLDSGRTFANTLLARDKKGEDSRVLLEDLLTFNEESYLLDLENSGLRKFELILSYGFGKSS